MPLLQFTLDQLFQQRSGRQLTLSAYRELGGVKGALTKQAEEIYTALPSEEHRKLARALFVRLIDPGVTEQDTTRRRAALSEFTLDDPTQTRLMRETIDTFIADRLLTTNEIAGTTTIEVSHEALIREWPRLAEWLREARDDIRLQQTISKDAANWEQHNKPGDRLYRGSQLKEAQAWAGRNTPSGNEAAFLRAGAVSQRFSIAGVIVAVLLLLSTIGVAGIFYSRIPPDPTRVTTLNDVEPGSLRWDIANAPSGSTITFDPSLWGHTIVLTADLPITEKHLSIQGPGARLLIISSRRHQIVVIRGASVTISGLSFQGSKINTTSLLSNEGTLTLSNSTVSGNTATGPFSGGGGIFNNGGTLTLSNSTVSDNRAGDGGGIFNNGGTLTLSNSIVSDNIAQRDGGGIFIQSSTSPGSLYYIAQVDPTFSTMYSNTAHNGGDIAIEDVDNSNGKPIKQLSKVKISNSIVAGDPAHPGPDIVGMLTSYGYNLFQDNSGATFDPATSKQRGTDRTLSVNDLTKLLAASVGLRNNGGPTRTYALGPGSPAIDAIPLQYCQVKGIFNSRSRMYIDQRGTKRPDENESACDIGAYESST